MARVSASAFKVLTFTLFPFPFVFFNWSSPFSAQSSSQYTQTGNADSDQGPILEPIQEASTDDTLVELSEQPEPDKVIKNLVDNTLIPLIKQPKTQRTNVWNAPVSQLRRSSEQAEFQLKNQLRYNHHLSFLHHSLPLTPCLCSKILSRHQLGSMISLWVIFNKIPVINHSCQLVKSLIIISWKPNCPDSSNILCCRGKLLDFLNFSSILLLSL
jgi:hypothetical protein